MNDLQTIGNRLRQIRQFLKLTQNEVAHSTNASQAAISRIEHGEEVYASVFISIITFYSTLVNIGNIFSPEFDLSDSMLTTSENDSFKKKVTRKIDTIKDELSEAHQAGMSQLDFLKKLIEKA